MEKDIGGSSGDCSDKSSSTTIATRQRSLAVNDDYHESPDGRMPHVKGPPDGRMPPVKGPPDGRMPPIKGPPDGKMPLIKDLPLHGKKHPIKGPSNEGKPGKPH